MKRKFDRHAITFSFSDGIFYYVTTHIVPVRTMPFGVYLRKFELCRHIFKVGKNKNLSESTLKTICKNRTRKELFVLFCRLVNCSFCESLTDDEVLNLRVVLLNHSEYYVCTNSYALIYDEL